MIQFIFIFAYVFTRNIILFLQCAVCMPPVIYYTKTGGGMADEISSEKFFINMYGWDIRKIDFFFCDWEFVYHARTKSTKQVRTFYSIEVVRSEGKLKVFY